MRARMVKSHVLLSLGLSFAAFRLIKSHFCWIFEFLPIARDFLLGAGTEV